MDHGTRWLDGIDICVGFDGSVFSQRWNCPNLLKGVLIYAVSDAVGAFETYCSGHSLQVVFFGALVTVGK